jgi:hypothetical protein
VFGQKRPASFKMVFITNPFLGADLFCPNSVGLILQSTIYTRYFTLSVVLS